MLRLLAFSLFGYTVLAFPVYANQPSQVGDVPPDNLGWASTGGKVKLSENRDKIVVFAVNWKESGDRYRAIIRTLKDVGLALVSDEYGHFGVEYGVKVIPHMIIIGRDGRIAAVHVGYGESEIPTLVKEINELWTQSSAPTPAPETTPESPAADVPKTDPISE
jgi:hypothetical protein